MSEEMMNTKEAAAYLGINEKQIYALIKAGRIPGTRLTGKWVFPKRLIDEWIETGAQVQAAVELIEKEGGTVLGIAAINIDENPNVLRLRAQYRCHALWMDMHE